MSEQPHQQQQQRNYAAALATRESAFAAAVDGSPTVLIEGEVVDSHSPRRSNTFTTSNSSSAGAAPPPTFSDTDTYSDDDDGGAAAEGDEPRHHKHQSSEGDAQVDAVFVGRAPRHEKQIHVSAPYVGAKRLKGGKFDLLWHCIPCRYQKNCNYKKEGKFCRRAHGVAELRCPQYALYASCSDPECKLRHSVGTYEEAKRLYDAQRVITEQQEQDAAAAAAAAAVAAVGTGSSGATGRDPLVDMHGSGMTNSVARLFQDERRRRLHAMSFSSAEQLASMDGGSPLKHGGASTATLAGMPGAEASMSSGDGDSPLMAAATTTGDSSTATTAPTTTAATQLDAIPKLDIPVRRQRQLLWHTQICVNGDSCRSRQLGFWCPFAHSERELRCVSFALFGKCLDQDRPEGCTLLHTGPRSEEDEITRIRAEINSHRFSTTSAEEDAAAAASGGDESGASPGFGSKRGGGGNSDAGDDSEGSRRSGRNTSGASGRRGAPRILGVPKHLLHASQVAEDADLFDSGSGRPRHRRGGGGGHRGQNRNPNKDPNDMSDEGGNGGDNDDNNRNNHGRKHKKRGGGGGDHGARSDEDSGLGDSGYTSSAGGNRSPGSSPGSTGASPQFPGSEGTTPLGVGTPGHNHTNEQREANRLKKHLQHQAGDSAPMSPEPVSREAFLERAERNLYKTEFCPSLHFCREHREYNWCDDAHDLTELRCPQFALTGRCPRLQRGGPAACPLLHTHESRTEAKRKWEHHRSEVLGIKATRLRPAKWRPLPPGVAPALAQPLAAMPEYQRKAMLADTAMCPLGDACVAHGEGLPCGQAHKIKDLTCPYQALYGSCYLSQQQQPSPCQRRHPAADEGPVIQVNGTSPITPSVAGTGTPADGAAAADGGKKHHPHNVGNRVLVVGGSRKTLPLPRSSSSFIDSETGEPLPVLVDVPSLLSRALSGGDDSYSEHSGGRPSLPVSPATGTRIHVPSASGAGAGWGAGANRNDESGMFLTATNSSTLVLEAGGGAAGAGGKRHAPGAAAAAHASNSNKDSGVGSDDDDDGGGSSDGGASNAGTTGSALPRGFVDRLWKTRYCPLLTFCPEYRAGRFCFGAHTEGELRCPQFALRSATAAADASPTAVCPRGTGCPFVHSTGTARDQKHMYGRRELPKEPPAEPPHIPEVLLAKHKLLKAAERRAVLFRTSLCPLGPGLCEDCDRHACFFAAEPGEIRCVFFACFGVCPKRQCGGPGHWHVSAREALERSFSSSGPASRQDSGVGAPSSPSASAVAAATANDASELLHLPSQRMWPVTPTLTPQSGAAQAAVKPGEEMDELKL